MIFPSELICESNRILLKIKPARRDRLARSAAAKTQEQQTQGPIPKGLRHKAQDCEERATLGIRSEFHHCIKTYPPIS